MFKKKLISVLWILLGVVAIGFLFIGAKTKGEKTCKGINIEVSENVKQVFIDEDGIKIEIQENGGKIGTPIDAIDLRDIEMQLKKDVWIKDAKLYFDNNQVLQVDLKENDPIARIFTVNGNSFFIDSAKNYLPTNRNVLARVPVFTGFTGNKEKLSPPDSTVLEEVRTIAKYVIADSVWMSFVSQINITPDATFQIIPIVGNSVITLGNADNLADKFGRLYSFYHQVLNKTGLNKYQRIDVQYDGQVVASTGKDSTVTINKPVLQDSLQNNKAEIKPVKNADVKQEVKAVKAITVNKNKLSLHRKQKRNTKK